MKTFDELTKNCNEICHHCREPNCIYCQEFLECSNNGYCNDDCTCLCVMERPNNTYDHDIFSEKFKTGCGNKINRKLIDEMRKLKTELVKERIQYKTLKDKQDKLITKQGLQIAEIVKQLNFKGFNIKMI